MPIAAATDAVTLAAAKARVREVTDAFDDELTLMIGDSVEKVEGIVACSIVERSRVEVRYDGPAANEPVRLAHRGLLLLPAVAERTEGDTTIPAEDARVLTLRYYAPGDDESLPPSRSVTRTHEARVEFTERDGPAALAQQLRFGHAWVYPPADGWPERAPHTPLTLEYSTGAPDAASVPRGWIDAALEVLRATYDGTNDYKPAMRLLRRWQRF